MINSKKTGKPKNEQFHPIITENDITEYVLERFQDVKLNPSMNEIIRFHSNNKYLFMAHNQEKLKILGNIVANHNKKDSKELIDIYESILINILNDSPTVKTHINVLMHIFGFFKTYFNHEQKDKFLNLIEEFRENKITLGKILRQIEPSTYQINSFYLVSQSYFLLYSEPELSNFQKLSKGSPRIKNNLMVNEQKSTIPF